MLQFNKAIFALSITSILAFSALGTAVAETFDRENIALSSVTRALVFGVVGAAILERTLQSTGTNDLSLPAPE